MNALRYLLLAGMLIVVPTLWADGSTPLPHTKQMPLTASPEAKPAFRYRLWPEPVMRTPGNAAVIYPRAFSPEFVAARANWPKDDRLTALQTMPLAELRAVAATPEGDVLRSNSLSDLEYAARMRIVDWELWDRIRTDGIHMLLPELQGYRQLAQWLVLKARLQMATGDFAGAARTLETCLSLGHDLGKAPTLIHSLVGNAIAQVALSQVEEWIRTPNSPNLYWALTSLPSPFFDLRISYSGERLFIDQLFPGIRERLADPTLPPLTTEKCREMYGAADAGLGETSSPFETLVAATRIPAAKQFLRDRGWTDVQIDAKPAAQVIMMYEIGEYDAGLDDQIKIVPLPYPQRLPRAAKSVEGLREALLAKALSPAIKVHTAAMRPDRQIAALRAVEAIRAHAAKAGSLPATLSEVTILDVPNDPATGQPFLYTKTDAGAALSSAVIPHAEQVPGFVYNITLAK